MVAVLYAAWLCRFLLRHSSIDLAQVARPNLAQGSGSSAAIDALAPHATNGGYDGQFALFVGLDPFHAHNYMDSPTYRLGRIIYPLTARLLAIGQPHLIPLSLVLVNVAAVVGGTLCLAMLLLRRNASPWFALLFGLSPAVFVSVDRDLTEPLAYALVICALLMLDTGRLRTSAVLFGFAGLTRETTLIFPVAILLAWMIGVGASRRRPRELALFTCLSIGPYVLLRLALLGVLGKDPNGAVTLAPYPFQGLVANIAHGRSTTEEVCVVLLPAVLALALALALVRRLNTGTLALVLNVLFLVILLPASSYDYTAAGRVTLGVVLAFILCIAEFPSRLRPSTVAALSVTVFLWLEPWIVWSPHAFLA